MDDPRVTTERRQAPRETIPSRFLTFTRAEWAPLRANTPLTLSDADLTALRGLNDVLSMEDVVEIYLPLSRLLSLYVQRHARAARRDVDVPRRSHRRKTPFIIGLAGIGGGGEEHHRAHPAGAALALAGSSARRPDHHRRLPAAQRACSRSAG